MHENANIFPKSSIWFYIIKKIFSNHLTLIFPNPNSKDKSLMCIIITNVIINFVHFYQNPSWNDIVFSIQGYILKITQT